MFSRKSKKIKIINGNIEDLIHFKILHCNLPRIENFHFKVNQQASALIIFKILKNKITLIN
ncbi:hypothetical protein BpHYR1_045985 [Brachionus plicatilis]|uniref:Uncharacterized protein n=1 Tax=Brachionus plicatilis TaxID=10195 RepID=A0A3M7T6X6_BRAPC|nr:hypothetical protein BpHYR1_045985 [Brachionus plicatilis]